MVAFPVGVIDRTMAAQQRSWTPAALPGGVPDEGHEAMRDFVRARAAAVQALRIHRQQVGAFMLKQGVEAVRIAKECVERLEKNIEEFLPAWSRAPVVRALQALRGVDLIVAVTFVTEVGDGRRFESPRQLMGYLGLVPDERSTGVLQFSAGFLGRNLHPRYFC